MNLNNLSWIAVLITLLSNAGYTNLEYDSKHLDQETARQVILSLTKANTIEHKVIPVLMGLLNENIAFENMSENDLKQLNSEINFTAKRIKVAASIV